MGKECGVTTPLGPAQPKALWLGNNKRGTLEESKGAHIRALTAPPHIHTHTHTQRSTQTHSCTYPPTPPSCADLLESAVVVGCLPPSEEARPLPPSPLFTPSFPLSLSLFLILRASCQGNADDMSSFGERSLEKVITAHHSSLSNNPFPCLRPGLPVYSARGIHSASLSLSLHLPPVTFLSLCVNVCVLCVSPCMLCECISWY